ncbi:Cytochrome P450 [Metarhizium album ARSEF 1941]|uniref:Cytochrome P450 n=1 Tax=Metarhizium album (strain ARSEF 1941) TaxID=1081103 RepID=A0A0B2X497_METAS|nr:Cytochrome P450 [Metarhizium album ARSEF 1941]KHO00583.1 Cytochrome P450 [Metarhizium album ARSEF 1941]
MIRELLYGVAAAALLAYTADFLFSLRDDPREPPRVRPAIPLVGHVLGIMRRGPTYYTETRFVCSAHVKTLQAGRPLTAESKKQRRVCGDAHPRNIPKHAKTLSFRPFLQITARKHGDASDKTYEIYGGDLTDRLSHAVRSSLAPGSHLDEQNLRMGKRVLLEVDDLLGRGAASGAQSIRLLEWTRHLVVQASSCGVYGDQHPLLDPEVEGAFWYELPGTSGLLLRTGERLTFANIGREWQKYLTAHLAGLDVFGKGYKQRKVVYDAYVKYCRELPNDGSELARQHKRVIREAGVDELDYAKQASLFTIAVFGNTAPTLYWTVWEVFSRPGILAEIRDEVESRVVSTSSDGEFTLHVAALKSKCPVLLSVFQETQRTRHVNASFRKVMADTVLGGRYLLKAGNFVQMPGQPIHGNTSLWGDGAMEFDPYRFVPDKKKDAAALPPSGFVAWGAPPHLCPARQFAAVEVLIATALLAVRADLQPHGGAWDKSPALNYNDLSTLLNPNKDVRVSVAARQRWVGKWSLEMGESRSRVPLASG